MTMSEYAAEAYEAPEGVTEDEPDEVPETPDVPVQDPEAAT